MDLDRGKRRARRGQENAASAASAPPPKKKKKVEKKEQGLDTIWICTECREAECISDPDAPLIICDGPCNRPFHPQCAGLLSLPSEDEPWLCADCVTGRHQCSVCKDYGEDGVDVFLCDVKGCGLYFHESCLGQYNVDVALIEDEAAVPGDEARTRPVFKCPAHKCWVCADDVPPPLGEGGAAAGLPATCVPVPAEGKGKKPSKKGRGRKNAKKSAASGGFSFGSKKENLMRCLDCPISYHISCIPPSARFHELALLCHEHAYTSKLPYLDAEHSMQACVEAKAEKKIEDLRRREERRAARIARGEIDGSDDEGGGAGGSAENKFLVGMHGADTTLEEDQFEQYLLTIEEEEEGGDDEEDGNEGAVRPRRRRKKTHLSYCLPVDFKEEVHSKPPAYAHVNSNRYDPDNRPRRSIFSGEKCRCKPSGEDGVPSCGERCDNRLNYFECCAANCDLGPNCGNRAMGRRRFAKCRVQREHGKGWGLISVDGVKSGDLVIEYAGEVIDESTKESRLAAWTRDHPTDPNFYVMALGQAGWYIDARHVANQARFVNHSCDPNCRLVPLNVAGHMRVAIVAVRDVRPGEFLSYDYQFDTRQGDRFTCRCGSSNCRGTMKGGGGVGDDSEAGKKTKKQLLAEAKHRVSRERKFLRSVAESEVTRLSLTGPVVPGSGGDETAEVVAAGPQAKKHREDAAAGRIFLWRNARAGGNFARRYRRWEERRAGGGGTRGQRGAALSALGRQGTVDVISIVVERVERGVESLGRRGSIVWTRTATCLESRPSSRQEDGILFL